MYPRVALDAGSPTPLPVPPADGSRVMWRWGFRSVPQPTNVYPRPRGLRWESQPDLLAPRGEPQRSYLPESIGSCPEQDPHPPGPRRLRAVTGCLQARMHGVGKNLQTIPIRPGNNQQLLGGDEIKVCTGRGHSHVEACQIEAGSRCGCTLLCAVDFARDVAQNRRVATKAVHLLRCSRRSWYCRLRERDQRLTGRYLVEAASHKYCSRWRGLSAKGYPSVEDTQRVRQQHRPARRPAVPGWHGCADSSFPPGQLLVPGSASAGAFRLSKFERVRQLRVETRQAPLQV